MPDELDVEERAVPGYRETAEDEGRANQPRRVPRRDEIHRGLALDDGEGEAPSYGQKGHDARQDDQAGLDGGGPERDHCPGLVHERRLDDDDEQQGEAGACHAEPEVVLRDRRVVPAPELVEVVEGGQEEGLEEGRADEAGCQAGHVEDRGRPGELRGRRHDEHDDEEDGARAHLEGVVDGDGDGLVVEGVDGGYGDGNGCRGGEERDRLLEGVERRGHGGKRGLVARVETR